MNSVSAAQLLSSIDRTVIDIDSVSGTNALTDSFLAKFLVVYIAGIYEECIESIVIDFVSNNANRQEVIDYVRKNLDITFRNPNAEKIITLAKKYLNNSKWASQLQSMTHEKRALDSIINNKNSIAHGHGSTVTLLDVKTYYADSRPFIEAFDSLLI